MEFGIIQADLRHVQNSVMSFYAFLRNNQKFEPKLIFSVF